MNAIAILIITGSQVYFDHKDKELEQQFFTIETEFRKVKEENIELRLKLKNLVNKRVVTDSIINNH